jgi:hypothetical protein
MAQKMAKIHIDISVYPPGANLVFTDRIQAILDQI